MKIKFFSIIIVLAFCACNKKSTIPSDVITPKGFNVAAEFPPNVFARNIIGLVSSPEGVLYICANVDENGIEKGRFFRLASGSKMWQQLGTQEMLGDYINNTVLDNAGNFYYAGDKVYKYSASGWSTFISPTNYGAGGTGGIEMAVSPIGEVYANMLNGAPPYNHSFLKFNGATWTLLGFPPTDPNKVGAFYPREMRCDNNGILYVGTYSKKSQNYIYKYDGDTSWSRLGSADYQLLTGAGIEIDHQNNIYIVGYKASMPNDSAHGDFIAKWDGTTWSEIPFPTGLVNNPDNKYIYTLTTDKNGNLYAAGTLMNNNGKYFIAKWNGTTWSELGAPNPVYLNNWIDLIDCDDQGVIYAAGTFTDSAGHAFVVKYVQ
ncbi:MAG: hypothetical protein PSX81_09160 [bacterium]|nr:hypothetical protein [bacterium]